VFFIFTSAVLKGCLKKENKQKLIVFHAASMAKILDISIAEYEKINPHIQVLRHSAGDVIICRKISELGTDCDILVNADYRLVEELLYPDYISWQILFAENEIVLAYNNMSKFNDLINKDNWHDIFLQKDIALGITNQDLCPLGYRSRFVLDLSEKYYNKPGLAQNILKKIKPSGIAKDSGELMPALECSHLDYVFQYLSLAKQHKQRIIQLPKEVNLGSQESADYYSQSRVSLKWQRNKNFIRCGEPIKYSYSITKNSKNPKAARDFLKFLLSKNGLKIIKDNYQTVITPFEFTHRDNIPESIIDSITAKSNRKPGPGEPEKL
jgi:molybdate/tungstate transport system substrate-binding protein